MEITKGITLTEERFSNPMAFDWSWIEGKLVIFSSISLTFFSLLVFFDFGELDAELFPSSRAKIVLILSAYVEYLLWKEDDNGTGSSRFAFIMNCNVESKWIWYRRKLLNGKRKFVNKTYFGMHICQSQAIICRKTGWRRYFL